VRVALEQAGGLGVRSRLNDHIAGEVVVGVGDAVG
jgi:hypothetical protein